jgi:hypothetical protein
MGVDVLLGFYEPKAYTAGAALAAGEVVKISANNTVAKVTAITDAVAGVCLIDAASGDLVTVVHGCWVKSVSGTQALGKLEPTASGKLGAYTSGTYAGFARQTGAAAADWEVFVF